MRTKRIGLLLLVAVLLSVTACQEREPDWEGITAATMAEAQANKAQAEVTRAEAEKRQADAQIAGAQAAQAQAGVNAEYAATMSEAIDGLVRVTYQAQSLLAVQTLLPYAIIGGLVVILGILGLLGVFLLRYQIAQANMQRALIQSLDQRTAFSYWLDSGGQPLLIRPGVRSAPRSDQPATDT